MKSAYFRELQRYSKQDIAHALRTDLDTVVKLLRRLKSCGVVKAVNPRTEESNRLDFSLQDENCSDVELTVSNQLFVFNYVGVIAVDDYVFNCYPKYIKSNSEPLQELKQVLQVIKKYNSKAHVVSMSNGLDEQSPFNMLAIMLFLIDDYYEGGLYSNQSSVLELNGEGEINWDTTINESFAFLIENRPVYTNLYTNNMIDDTDSIIRRIHQSIISYCSKLLHEVGLSDLFGIEDLVLTDEILEDIGDEEYLLYQLSKELNVQFITRKQILLKTLFAFISQRSILEHGFGLSMYGTSSFHTVWQDVCAAVFGSHLHCKLKDLPITLSSKYTPSQNLRLIELIEKPKWIAYVNGRSYQHLVSDTLIPDLITIFQRKESTCFGIFDAKYYVITLDEFTVSGQPGIGDITKQYLYERAYTEFLQHNNISDVLNAFLCPGSSSCVEILGEAELDMLHSLGLSNIQVWKLPTRWLFAQYLANVVIDISRDVLSTIPAATISPT